MGFKDFIKDTIKEEMNKTPEQKQEENLDKIRKKYKDYVLDDENFLFYTYNLKGTYVFLDKRILFHDDRIKKGTKQEYHTIPYKNIKRFTIENAGIADLDVDIKLFLGGSETESITLKVPIDSAKTINKIILQKIL